MDLQAFVANLLDFVYDHIKTQKMWVEAVRKDAYLPELPCDHVKTQLKCENVAKRKGWAFSFVTDQLKTEVVPQGTAKMSMVSRIYN